MSDRNQKSRRAARKLAERDGIKYTAARRLLIELGHWGRGARFYDELLSEMDAKGLSLTDLAQQHETENSKGEGA